MKLTIVRRERLLLFWIEVKNKIPLLYIISRFVLFATSRQDKGIALSILHAHTQRRINVNVTSIL